MNELIQKATDLIHGKRASYPYCIQCTDITSGAIGDFAYDPRNGRRAITPVFTDLCALYTWCKQNGITLEHN